MQLQKQALKAAKQALIGHSDESKEVNEALVLIDQALAEQPAQTDWEAVAADQAMTIALLKAEQPAQQEPVSLGPLAKRRVFDYIRGAYDLGYNDARNEKAIPGDSAPGYKGRDVEADHGSALFHALEAINALREAPAERPSKPDYVWPTVADYERDVGFQTNEAFRVAWDMARTTNTILGIKENT